MMNADRLARAQAEMLQRWEAKWQRYQQMKDGPQKKKLARKLFSFGSTPDVSNEGLPSLAALLGTKP